MLTKQPSSGRQRTPKYNTRLAALFLTAACLGCGDGRADEVRVEFVRLELLGGQHWNVHTTLSHADDGWQHYADAWRIVDAGGVEIARRTLAHPHVDEQPFTRSLHSVFISDSVHVVTIEARDNVHGWSVDSVRVDLRSSDAGERYEVGP